jgi:hypothetical protein
MDVASDNQHMDQAAQREWAEKQKKFFDAFITKSDKYQAAIQGLLDKNQHRLEINLKDLDQAEPGRRIRAPIADQSERFGSGEAG